jgi:hypothetical protein
VCAKAVRGTFVAAPAWVNDRSAITATASCTGITASRRSVELGRRRGRSPFPSLASATPTPILHGQTQQNSARRGTAAAELDTRHCTRTVVIAYTASV